MRLVGSLSIVSNDQVQSPRRVPICSVAGVDPSMNVISICPLLSRYEDGAHPGVVSQSRLHSSAATPPGGGGSGGGQPAV